MTRINRLEMKGFKSFNNKTQIFFGDKFNCVLGPNGSGKSNVLDAICFVLGKSSSKALRAEKSANLIYNGGKTKKPAPHGEVSIYFDNKEGIFKIEEDEVKITRIITKTGQSKYKINDKTSTRNQILDMMSLAKINPDGYNIVLQGDVVRFTEMPTDKRRKVIEEIAGINIYEEKKQKATRELEKVQEQLSGAEIILKEKKTHLNELKKDRDEALKYKELNDKIRYSKAAYIKIQKERKEAELEENEDKRTKLQEEFDGFEEKVKKIKEENEERKKGIKEITDEIERTGGKDQINLSKELENLRIEIARKKERISLVKNELERVQQRKEQLLKNKEEIDKKVGVFGTEKRDLEQEVKSKEVELKQVEEAIERFKQKNKLGEAVESIDKELEKLDKEEEELQKNIDDLRKEQQESIREKDKFDFMISTLDEKIKKVSEVEKENKKEIQELKKKKDQFKEATQKLSRILTDDSAISVKLGQIKKELQYYEEELGKLQVRSEAQKETSMQNKAVESIIKGKKQGVFGTVSSLGKVSSKYATALEIAAGGRLNGIIVEDDSVAASCIDFLKKQQLGVATFLPLNKMRSVELGKKPEGRGVIDFAINLVTYDSKFKKAFSYVLSNTVVVEDVETARRIGIGKYRMVTLAGDIMELSGAMQGGHRAKKKGGFQEVELGKGLMELEEKISDLRTEVGKLMGQKDENEQIVYKLREEKATLEGEIIKQEKSLHLDTSDLDSTMNDKESMREKAKEMDKKIDEIQDKISESNRELAMLKVKKQQEKTKISALRNPTVLAELNTLEERRKKILDRISHLNIEIKGVNTQIQNIFGPELESIEKILKQQEKEVEDFKQERSKLEEGISEEEETIKEKEKQEKQFNAKFRELFETRKKLEDAMDKARSLIEDLQEKSRKIEHKLNTTSLEGARIKAELSGINEDFAQYSDIEVKIEKTETELKKEIEQFEKMRENLGNINMRALEIYEQVEEEYGKLVEKKEGLDGEKKQVLELMEEIETKKKEMFLNTFNVINENFKNKFLSLSTKGNAFLVLENEKEPFEGGVGVKVKLSGNKYMDVRSLSGGEKTMTALAFIFAMQEHEPASFYVLDEVDAALDKHNSERLADLIRSYCGDAQYIVISHNDGVISEADNLYGVSMDQHGMSKVTSLKA